MSTPRARSSAGSDYQQHSSPLIVIINPASGSMSGEKRAALEAALSARAVPFEVRETTVERGAARIVAEAVETGAKEILACGGDGTVMAAVNGLAHPAPAGEVADHTPPVALSIIPCGTANLLAGALGIPTGMEEAIDIALDGVERVIDLGRCGDTLFALGLGLGLTEKLVSQASTKEKEKFGKLAYVHAMLRELGARPSHFRFKLDDKRVRRRAGVAVVVANAGEIGGGITFAPDARMDDGLLDLCILHRFYARDLVRMAWNSLRGDLRHDRAVSFYQARRIEIWSEPPLDLQIDGEEVDRMVPLVVEIAPRALRVRVPRKEADSFQPVE